MSSLFLTSVSNLGKTLMILLNYSGYSWEFVYLRRKHSKSKIYYNIEASTIEVILCSLNCYEDAKLVFNFSLELSSDNDSDIEQNLRPPCLLSSFAV